MMTDDSIMPFGKYKGKKLIDVPAYYLLWCCEQEWCRGNLKEYIEYNKSELELEAKTNNNQP